MKKVKIGFSARLLLSNYNTFEISYSEEKEIENGQEASFSSEVYERFKNEVQSRFLDFKGFIFK